MDIECRWLDSFHDAKVFCSSKININLKVKEIPSTELTTRPGYDAISNYIIGDPAYPLMSYCIQKLLPVQISEAVLLKCSVKSVLRNFTKFAGNHLFQSLFFNKIAGLSLQLY